MRTTLACFAAVCLVGVTALALPPSQQVRLASAGGTPSVDDILKEVRSDLQTSRADIIAKNVVLTSEQAAKFWPVFEKYQKEQGAILHDQLEGIKKYAEKYETLDDAAALGLMKAHLDRDRKMVTLRQTYLAEFQKVLPARLAVRVVQIDRRVSLAHQIEFASQIPLVR